MGIHRTATALVITVLLGSPEASGGEVGKLTLAGTDPAIHRLRMPPKGSVLCGVFEGKVPCEDCNKTKVALTLHWDAKDHFPTRYLLERVGVGKGDERHVSQGVWKRTLGSPYGKGPVIRLGPEAPEGFRDFLMVGEDILLILDGKGRPRVGDATYSFTLSRTGPSKVK